LCIGTGVFIHNPTDENITIDVDFLSSDGEGVGGAVGTIVPGETFGHGGPAVRSLTVKTAAGARVLGFFGSSSDAHAVSECTKVK
jgi:hypothetical protein